MIQKKGNINNFTDRFSGWNIITIDDVRQYFRVLQPEIKDNAVRVRIHALKESGVIQSVGRGSYVLQNKPVFKPEPTGEIKKIAGIINQNFDIDYCISTTAWFNEFSLHQAWHYLLILEAEKDFLMSLFDVLRDGGKREVYLNPGKKTVDLYVNTARFPIVLKPLTTRAPLQKVSGIWLPTLEKMLVDLFVDKVILHAYQGKEIIHVFEKAIRLFQINFARLSAYAARRRKKTELQNFLIQRVSNFPKTLLL